MQKTKKTWEAVITSCTFLFLIILGTVASIFSPKKTFSENENRVLQQMPKFSKDTFLDGTFEKGYENFVTDQFFYRDRWIACKTNIERMLQKKDINGVYFGKDHYLIERHMDSDVKEEQVQKNIDYLTKFINQTASVLGEDHVRVMLVQTASEILKDKMPAYAYGYDQEQVIREVKDQVPAGTFVDVTQTLKDHADEYIYYKTDHHWTSLGAYYAYEQWAFESGLTPFSQEEFDIVKVSDQFYGTIASKVNVDVVPDELNLYVKKGNPVYEVTYNEEKTSASLYEYKHLETKDKYRVYLNGNNALVKIKSQNQNGKRLLVIKDSFSHCFVPFLVDHYEEVYMIDFRYFKNSLKEFMNANEFTDVLVLYNVMQFVKEKNMLYMVR